MSDEFELYDLKIGIEAITGTCTCDHAIGDFFELKGGKIHMPAGQPFCLYALQSTLPLLPAKQRATDNNDWMASDAEVACPDPHCPTRFRITRTGRRPSRSSNE